jgi:hypothetical protein
VLTVRAGVDPRTDEGRLADHFPPPG